MYGADRAVRQCIADRTATRRRYLIVWRRGDKGGHHVTEDRARVSRRTALQAVITMAAMGVVDRASAQQAPAKKVAQNVVQYQTSPKNGQSCNKCVNFVPPNSCKLVAGTISPSGWCLLFAPKPPH
jgi:hypothetical protein